MTQEELDNLIELKYQEIAELEVQKEELLCTTYEYIAKKMLENKYYIVQYKYASKSYMLIHIKEYEFDNNMLFFKGVVDSYDIHNDDESMLGYHNYDFIPIDDFSYDTLKTSLDDYHEVSEDIHRLFNEIKNKN